MKLVSSCFYEEIHNWSKSVFGCWWGNSIGKRVVSAFSAASKERGDGTGNLLRNKVKQGTDKISQFSCSCFSLIIFSLLSLLSLLQLQFHISGWNNIFTFTLNFQLSHFCVSKNNKIWIFPLNTTQKHKIWGKNMKNKTLKHIFFKYSIWCHCSC